MATTKATPAPAPKVELPATFEVAESTAVFTRESAPNPLAAQVAIANVNRSKSYEVKGVTSEAMATKVVNLLRSAGKGLGVSVRTQYRPDSDSVLFSCRDKITRQRQAK